MKNKTISKKNFFSKFIAKIVRKFGYEIIDQANLEVTETNILASENLSKNGEKSITVPLGSTKIKEGVKLDNQIHIAHNVEIDKHTVIAAQTGVA